MKAKRVLAGALGRVRGPIWPKPYAAATPPVVPPGWETGAPDFVGIGGQKCGTTWWYELLRSHPEVVIADGLKKELHVLDRFFERPFTAADIAAYHRLFPRPTGARTGEWTTSYASSPWVALLLSVAAPSARILFLVRDPVARYRSGLTHHLARGAPRHAIVAGHAFERGRYGAQLAHLLGHVERSNVLVLQYEQCRADAGAQFRRTCDFLEIDATFVPRDMQRPRYVTKTEKVAVPDHVERSLAEYYAEDIRTLAALCPDLDLDRWTSAR